jgi:hypothetical protein
VDKLPASLRKPLPRPLILGGLAAALALTCVCASLVIVKALSSAGDGDSLVISLPQGTLVLPQPGALSTLQMELATALPEIGEDVPVVEYPYITGITAHSREIFRQGQGGGNRAGVFSKVGDSLTANEVFLVPIGRGNYELHDHVYLASAIGYFSTMVARDDNSFANTSLAAGFGWRAGNVLNPDLADPATCQPGESPLLCEYRLVRPSVALIMLGTNDVPVTALDRYEATMREIIETTVDLGIIPVISTIPPFAGEDERVLAINRIVVDLAEEYGIPLWNFYAVVRDLPNGGLAGDGVHLTWNEPADFSPENLPYGMTMRNLTALQVLDAIYRNVILPEM